ncbi:hypothetical protein [Variovorax arabinosiphilus]|uniref:hypothetical protein n=1 Tax=Variovorax arabinosiphilus TaxID=3053498 RepID=UPI00257544C2|nr:MULTISPECIES: hypothetical protein [unclassified Variovorax]MDM0118355.1 hypothetical protein [Variovorax sp. J2L1-78]MDM0128780.1 hypothetical protein [Variovorax sp. J2L1-63]MDM0233434.1 hypothetical protein [Variovorax sp. J2R1-6]
MSRFVLLYQGTSDPSRQEERSVMSALKTAKVVDHMPGSILVEGPEAEVAAVVQQCQNWTFSPVRSVGVAPPHKHVKAPV